MNDFHFQSIGLNGAFMIDDFHVGDKRGSFTKLFEKQIFQNAGIEFTLNETFASVSAKNVIRGLHFQMHNPQAKIVTVLYGAVWDVIVDLRIGSPTFKKWKAIELSALNHHGLYVPKGFAHGFMSFEEGTIMLYQCDGAYDGESDTGIRYDDIDIGIEWPIDQSTAIFSDRDLGLPTLAEYLECLKKETKHEKNK